MPSRQTPIAWVVVAIALFASGCARRTVRAAPPMANPTPPAEPVTTRSSPLAVAPPPETKLEVKPEIAAPAKPETTKPEEKPEPLPDAALAKPAAPRPARRKPVPPQLSPRLSLQDQAQAERLTNEDIGIAERNLQVAYGKQLNAAQHDLVEKIRGFLAQAREAIRASDWVRARNLAQKAHLLSIELVNSL